MWENVISFIKFMWIILRCLTFLWFLKYKGSTINRFIKFWSHYSLVKAPDTDSNILSSKNFEKALKTVQKHRVDNKTHYPYQLPLVVVTRPILYLLIVEHKFIDLFIKIFWFKFIRIQRLNCYKTLEVEKETCHITFNPIFAPGIRIEFCLQYYQCYWSCF